jgi:hypothetical protein
LPFIPAGGALPVSDSSDVLAVLPVFVRASDSAPVRDAIAAGLAAILKRHQELSAYAAAQSDLLRATGLYLDGACEEHGVFRQPGEEDEALRARALTTPDLVTPEAILATANAILAPWTTKQPQYLESGLDRLFISDGSASWHSFIGASPSYPDRCYPDDHLLNRGGVRPQSDPGAAWVFSDNIGRYFVLRVPVVAFVDVSLAYAGERLAPSDPNFPQLGGAEPAAYPPLGVGDLPPASGGRGLFIGDGSSADVATFVFPPLLDPLSVYQAVAVAVDRIKGHSIRWMLVVDERL